MGTVTVECSIPWSIQVADVLQERGLAPATEYGVAFEYGVGDRLELDILKGAELVRKRMLFGLVSLLVRRPRIGTIEFTDDGPWKIKCYGRENEPELRSLADDLTERFEVDITVDVCSNEQCRERSHWEV